MISAKLRCCVWVLVGLVVTAISYHGTVLSGLDKLTYDGYDGRLLIGIADHWYRVIIGEAEWRNLPIFYPEENTLGYSDALLALGVPHALLRLLGTDRYLAAQLSSMFLTWLGFVGMYHLSSRLFRWQMGFALYAAALYCLLSPLILVSLYTTHVQLLAIHIVPWILLALFELLRFQKPLRGWLCWALLLGFLVGACLMTGFYTGWFLAFFFVLFCIVATAFWWVPTIRQPGKQLIERDTLKRLLVRFGVAGGLTLLCLIPFVMTYAPVAKRGYERTFEEVHHGLPVPVALMNPGQSNLLWGDLIAPLLADEARRYDMIFGFPPFTLFLFVLATFWIFWQLRRNADPGVRWLAAGVAVCWIWLLLTLRLGEWTLWRYVFEVFPRADLIRIPQRGNILLCIPVALSLAFAGRALWEKAGRSIGARAAILLVAIVVVVEQIPSNSPGRLSRSHELEYLASHPPAPGKGVFTIVDSGFMDGWASHVYALELAQERGLVSFDGYSGFPPAYWHWVQPGSPKHLSLLLPFLDKQDLDQPVYGYSVPERAWYPLVDSVNPIRTELGATIDFSIPESAQHLDTGFAPIEDGGARTTDAHAVVCLWPRPISDGDLTLRIQAGAFADPQLLSQVVQVGVNWVHIGTLDFGHDPSAREWVLRVPDEAVGWTGFMRITFDIAHPTSPQSRGLSGDERMLGMFLLSLTVDRSEP